MFEVIDNSKMDNLSGEDIDKCASIMIRAFDIVIGYKRAYDAALKSLSKVDGASNENIKRYSDVRSRFQAAHEVFIASYGHEAYSLLSEAIIP